MKRGSGGAPGPGRPDEGALIDAFLRPFDRGGEGVVVGPGSDCAAVRPSRGQRLVATTDAVIEGVHFDRRWFSPEDVGHKALAVNLSDLAAAGARPRWFLCALGVPRGAPRAALACAARMARGMAALARAHGCALIGGNVAAAAEWSVTITALGEARRPLTRAGGRPGDALVLAGRLGDAAAALRLLQEEVGLPSRSRAAPRRGSAWERSPLRPRGGLLRAQLRPAPLVAAGLAAAGLASAAVDVSDGLLRDLGHLCAQSLCGAVVECDALPIGRLARRQPDALALALAGGEDYALLLAVRRRRLRALLRRLPGAVEIGRLLPPRAGLSLTDGGAPRPLPRRLGFDHLA